MSDIFYSCLSLKSLPDISRWKTNNVTNMNYMFYGCSSLTLLISHLDISGNDDKDEQSQNIRLILVTFLVFHLDILDNDDSDEQFLNI